MGSTFQMLLQKVKIAGAEDREQKTEDRRINGLGPTYYQ
jgi:hypothetical protein